MLDPKTHEITIANAGHPPAILRRVDGTVVELGEDVAGTPLGVVPDQHYETSTFTLNPGESILLYSDGIIDAMNANEEIYSRRRLRSFLKTADGPVKEVAGGLLRDIEEFAADQPVQTDDVSLVCFQRLEVAGG